jgi:hypothetical protein
MYCYVCEEMMYFGDELKDENGCHWPHDVQVCKNCRPKDVMTKSELEDFLGVTVLNDPIRW